MRIEEPWLGLVALLLLMARAAAGSFFRPRRMVFSLPFRKQGAAGVGRLFLQLPLTLRWGGVVLLVIALMRPQVERQIPAGVQSGRDIVIALDISRSMLEIDAGGESRLDAAKKAALRFVADRSQDRIGLVVFSESAVTRSPLTRDHRTLGFLLEQVSVGDVSGSGTAVGPAVLVAVNRLRSAESPERIVILLTDGEQNAGGVDPVTAASIAAEHGVRIHAVSTGVPGEPDRRGDGMLREMAALSGGGFFRASDPGDLLTTLREIIVQDSGRMQHDPPAERRELYPLFLLGAGLLLAAALVMDSTRFRRLP